MVLARLLQNYSPSFKNYGEYLEELMIIYFYVKCVYLQKSLILMQITGLQLTD